MVSPVMAQTSSTGANAPIIVTAQRQSQSLQDVPIAVSAFDSEALQSQQIENASDLQLTLPNVSFTKSNFTASSFTIRGIGDLCVGNSCDAATAIHLNSAPLFGTRLFEAEYFDVERIEVLRGPQGTLFGRNATSGVVNVVTARPDLGGFAASGQVEYGNYDSFEVQGMVNVPIADWLGIRAAGIYVNRDGYTRNLFDNSRIDGRDLYGLRGSIRIEPGPDTIIDLIGYYFREDDDRLRIQKQTCQRDPTGVLGCLNARREFGQVNSNSNFTGVLTSAEFYAIAGIPTAFALGSVYGPDAYANFTEPQDPRVVNTPFTPEYFTDELQLQAHFEHDFGDVNLSLTGTYSEGTIESRQDYNLGIQDRTFFAPALNTLAAAAQGLVPGLPASYFAPVANAIIPNGPDGQLCTSDTVESGLGSFGGQSICGDVPLQFDRSNADSHAWTFEGIVTSDFDGPVNFLLGAIYAERDISNGDYYVNAFPIDYLSGILGAFNSFPNALPPSFLGSPYFRSNTQSNRLESYGVFGEIYWDITDDLTFTGGLRYNIDEKETTQRTTLADFLVPHGTSTDIFDSPFAVAFDADPGRSGNQIIQERSASFNEITGRAVLDWQYTPDNSVYISYSRGYKSGGINPPLSPLFQVPETFQPESIDAFEIGSRNVLFDGELTLNATAFYYKYSGLQLSRIVARTSVNDNIDANIWGLELEAVWNPIEPLLINFGASYLNTEVSDDRLFVNQRDPSGGDPNSVIVKDLQAAFNCAVTSGSLANTAGFVTAVNGGLGLQGPTAFPADSGLGTTLGAFSICNVLAAQSANPALQALFPGIQVFAGQAPGIDSGIPVSINGNELPQAPDYKISIGAQYTAEFDNGMSIVPRVDAAYTGESFGNIFNGDINRLPGYWQVNAQLQFNGADDRWFVRAFVQNLFNDDPVTGLYLTDQSSGLFTNIFTLEPRRYGIAAGFNF
nr:TonB-dependent receptor [Parasphingopyxis sp.]